MKNHSLFYLTIILFLMLSCSEKKNRINEKAAKPAVTILIQPFKDIKQETVVKVTEGIKNVYPNVKVLNAIDFPENTLQYSHFLYKVY